MESFVRRWSQFAVLACCALSACGERSQRDLAKLEVTPDRLVVSLILPTEIVLEEVSYTVAHADNGTVRIGRSKLSASGAFELQVGSLPVGSGYALHLSGVTSVGSACAASASFEVVSRAIMTLPVSMRCDAIAPAQKDRPGELRVSSGIYESAGGCPDVAGISAAPLDIAVGAPLKVEGFTTSPTPVRWKFSGFVAAPYAWTTRAYCTHAGIETLAFETLAQGCPTREASIEVACTEQTVPACGNSLLDEGEECDDGNLAAGDGCADCRREPIACAVDFPCLERTTFCVGTTQTRAARTIACEELCGSSDCTGAGCGATGPLIGCAPGEVCIDDETLPYWQHDARCLPLPSFCEGVLCPPNHPQCAGAEPRPEACGAACEAGFCCTRRAREWVKVDVACGG